ncbi:MAG: ABC transporter permease [Anaerolineales bacterium]|nr:ABC transporter permease [Anaerolineales bacterium]
MTSFYTAFWTESLKAFRSKVPWITFAAFSAFPIIGGVFMMIMRNPEQARAMGLVGAKAQLLSGGTVDWQSYFDFLSVGTAGAGAILFAFIFAWVFGREFSDHTAKQLLALPTRRETIVWAKLLLSTLWILCLGVWIFLLGILVGAAISLPGWSSGAVRTAFGSLMLSTFLTALLMPLVALFASAGRGYLPPLAWAFGTLGAAQIAGLMGWGDRFPWAVPGMVSMMFSVVYGARAEGVGVHSYVLVMLTCLIGVAATIAWWRSADQSK